MNKFRLATLLIFVTFLAISAYSQTAPVKVVLINTQAFYDDKIGITKLVAAQNQLDKEFENQIRALQDGTVKLQAIANELQTNKTLTQAQAAAKQDEGQRLQRELNYKKSELETAIGKRRQVVVGPISQDIGNGITEFAKKNGYGVVLDTSKLDEAGALLFLADSADVTKDFIAFYNARSAAPTTPAKPK